MALNSLFCADVPFRHYSHSTPWCCHHPSRRKGNGKTIENLSKPLRVSDDKQSAGVLRTRLSRLRWDGYCPMLAGKNPTQNSH